MTRTTDWATSTSTSGCWTKRSRSFGRRSPSPRVTTSHLRWRRRRSSERGGWSPSGQPQSGTSRVAGDSQPPEAEARGGAAAWATARLAPTRRTAIGGTSERQGTRHRRRDIADTLTLWLRAATTHDARAGAGALVLLSVRHSPLTRGAATLAADAEGFQAGQNPSVSFDARPLPSALRMYTEPPYPTAIFLPSGDQAECS